MLMSKVKTAIVRSNHLFPPMHMSQYTASVSGLGNKYVLCCAVLCCAVLVHKARHSNHVYLVDQQCGLAQAHPA